MKQILIVVWITLLTVAPALAEPQTREQASAELKAVRDQIDTLKEDIEDEGRRRSRAERNLAEVEKSEQKVRRELTSTRKQLRDSKARQADLERQSEAQRKELKKQRTALANQLRVAYINGNEEWLRVSLSQKDATSLGRRMTYYGYLSRQRRITIEKVGMALKQLEEIQAEISRELAQLAKFEAEATEKLAEIADTRKQRAELVNKINADIRSKDAQIERLQAQASELTNLVEALAKVLPKMPDIDAEPFAGQAASLSWPADGSVLKSFGDSRADGRLKWQGVLLGAPAGAVVRSVYHGRVVFSDWLDGMGLLTIIDHGAGYMSLYGHNQDLLKEVGEWVDPGEAIAHVGDSGGQVAAGLYFEIRKDGKPVNPKRWIR
jgi:septal ring factor EnvC (AmiA/AmiB activator)